jgi:hypothetical protein
MWKKSRGCKTVIDTLMDTHSQTEGHKCAETVKLVKGVCAVLAKAAKYYFKKHCARQNMAIIKYISIQSLCYETPN